LLDRPVRRVTLLGSKEKLVWSEGADALSIETPGGGDESATVFKVVLGG